jgi:carboxymethylenebutenolidase
MGTTAGPTQDHDILAIWQQHTHAEFVLRDPDVAVTTMTDDAYLLFGSLARAVVGKAAIRETYAVFIPQNPPDLAITTLSRVVGEDMLTEEMIMSFTHDREMAFLLPGVPPTGRHVELPYLGFIGFRGGKIAFERLYWDQATVLQQVGLLDPSTPAVAGADAARLAQQLAGVAGPP